MANKPVVIEIQARDGASKVLRPIASELTNIEKAGDGAASGAKNAGSNMVGLAVKIGGVAAAYKVMSTAAEGFTLGAGLDQSRRTLGTLLGDMERGNKVYAESIAFGEKWGFTQREIASASAAAAGILKNTNQTTEQTLGVLARLSSLNPAEGIEGATFARSAICPRRIATTAQY